jgi:hypothetical protein
MTEKWFELLTRFAQESDGVKDVLAFSLWHRH